MATTYRLPILKSRREYFRLPYPVTSGATLDIDGTHYKVEEVSERGLRVVADPASFPVDAEVSGTLILTIGLRCKILGKVLRIESGGVVVKLDLGPTTYDINREQRHLSREFPNWKPIPADY